MTGGTATGSFTLDLTTSTLSNVNITTSTDSALSLGTTYTSGSFSNSPASFDFGTGFFLEGDEFDIALASALTPADLASSNSFAIASGEEDFFFILCFEFNPEGICASRSVTGGFLDAVPTATPLPAALPLFAGGLGAIGLCGWRRKMKAAILAA
jgi:hypothetical protein